MITVSVRPNHTFKILHLLDDFLLLKVISTVLIFFVIINGLKLLRFLFFDEKSSFKLVTKKNQNKG